MEHELSVQVVVLIVSYNGSKDLRDCLASIQAASENEPTHAVIVVDNDSQDDTADLVHDLFPKVTLIRSPTNLGFAAGNNLGWHKARELYPTAEYLYLLNQDTMVQIGWLAESVKLMRDDPQIGCLQSILYLDPDRDRINTSGNASHYLGFGFPTDFGKSKSEVSHACKKLAYASGAALLVRMELLEQLGLFESEFFMYLEDADLSWKIRLSGKDVRLSPRSVVYHRYQFKNDYRFYFHLEKNRLWLLLVYYRLRTLLLLMPAIVVMELGQLAFATGKGRLVDKLRSYHFLLKLANRRAIQRHRSRIQKTRRINDRDFLSLSSGTIETPQLNESLLRFLVNPLFGIYWRLVKRLLHR